MKRQLVYDLPTRLFHWLFAAFFLTAFIIAKTIDDDSAWFNYHSLAGLTLGFLALLRIVWGFFGTHHARFSGFALKPIDLMNYFKAIITGEKRRWAGHNPASSWAGIIMLILALGLAATGYLMTSGPNKETFEDIHELFANAFLSLAVMHVVGVVIESIRLKHMIGFSMLHGKKYEVKKEEEISHDHKGVAVILFFLVLSFSFYLHKNFNTQTGVLSVFNQQLQILEIEEEEED